jgi:SAM-dependent methyltransferase
VATDYDTDPERFREGRRLVQSFGLDGDVHEPVAARLTAEALAPVLDLGSGDGALAAHLTPASRWTGLDASPVMAAAGPRPVILADGSELPVASGSVGAVAALWMLYHLDDPVAAIAEGHRVLRPGGLFVACTTRRDDSPELLEHLGPQPASPFDGEEAAELIAGVFDPAAVEVDAWDAPLVELPTRESVASYLRARQIDEHLAADIAGRVAVPLLVTKRGVLVWARKAS